MRVWWAKAGSSGPFVHPRRIAGIDRKAIRDWFTPALTGLDPLEREVGRDRMSWLLHNHTARGAVDVAMWDVIGQAVGQPVRMLLGGYTGTMAVAHIVFAASPEGMVDEAIQMPERYGFATFKIKVGKDPAADAQALRSLRAAPDIDDDKLQHYRIDKD